MNEQKNAKQKQRPHLRLYLYKLRNKAGLSIYEVTNTLLLSKPYYYQIEQGLKGHRMDVIFLKDLAHVLKSDFKTLCEEELKYQKERRKLGLRHDARWVYDDEL